MKLSLLVYLASIAGGISKFLMIFGIVFLVLIVLLIINIAWQKDFGDDESVEQARNLNKKSFKPLLSIGILFIIFSILIPSEKTIYIMAGAYATEQIANNERVQKIGSDVLEVIENKLEKLKEDK